MDGRQTKPIPTSGERGFICLKCGHQGFRVIYTRRAIGRRVNRRRECRKCGWRVTTWEQMIGMG
jgi:transcriptional regulator NrdR family protein